MVKVLFVCSGNACRSQIAEAFARRHGAGVLDAHSAGTQPHDSVDARAAEALQRRGYDLSMAVPKTVDAVPPGPYEWMIRMGCGDVLLVPALHREDWSYPPPSMLNDRDFEALCDELEARVCDLVERAQTWAEATAFPIRSVLPVSPSIETSGVLSLEVVSLMTSPLSSTDALLAEDNATAGFSAPSPSGYPPSGL